MQADQYHVWGRTPRAIVSVAVMLLGTADGVALGGEGEGRLECQTTLAGPCEVLDTVNVLVGPVSRPAELTLVANFGTLARGADGRLAVRCEEVLGGLAARTRQAPSGALFVAGDRGVIRHGAASDQCVAQPSTGAVAGRAILDVAFDPAEPRRVYALGQDPRLLHVSDDGGASFTGGWRFAAAHGVLKLVVAPSRPQTIHAVGETVPGGDLLLLRSDDRGATFEVVEAAAGASPPGLPLDLLGIDPRDAAVLYVAVVAPGGAQEVWKSRDGGRSWARKLALRAGETLGGFAFGATPDVIHVAARQELLDPTMPPGRLHVSGDGGESWAAPLPSAADGPRYRCLAFRDGTLYACAAGPPGGDRFLLGASRDGGGSWQALMTMAEIAGSTGCHRDACAATDQWLCETYRLCGGPMPPGGGRAQGCSCDVAGGAAAPAASLVAMAALAAVVAWWRRRLRGRS
jgi:hypothetical protein